MHALSFSTPVGDVTLSEDHGAVVRIDFRGDPSARDASPVLVEAAAQLREYFAGEREAFRIPLAPEGTPFQRAVWEELSRIPYGKTVSYGEIARRIGKPGAARAVGMANHVNPLPIVVPCHRVVGSDGSLTGYGGGLSVKETLLTLEQSHRK